MCISDTILRPDSTNDEQVNWVKQMHGIAVVKSYLTPCGPICCSRSKRRRILLCRPLLASRDRLSWQLICCCCCWFGFVGIVVRALDLQPRGRRFELHVTTLDKLFTHLCLCSPSSINRYRRKQVAKPALHATQ